MIDENRLSLLTNAAKAMGLKPEVVTPYGLVSVTIEGKNRYLFHRASNPNKLVPSRLAMNKHATRVIMERAGLPNIPFCLPANEQEAQEFLSTHKKIIVKPTKGKMSQDIHLVTDAEELAKLDITDCIFEKFIKGQETRFLVVDGKVEAVHYKMYEGEINDPKTVRRVSLERSEWDENIAKNAVQAADALGLIFTAVDFMVTEDAAYILEVNSSPGIERFQSPDEGPAIDIARMYLVLMVRELAA